MDLQAMLVDAPEVIIRLLLNGIWIYEGYLWSIFTELGLGVHLVHHCIPFNICKPIHFESMPRIKRMVVDGCKREICVVHVFEFNEHASADSHFAIPKWRVSIDRPFAVVGSIVPWHKDVICLDLNALTREFFADFCDKFLPSRLVDYRDAVDDKNVVQGIVV